MIQFYNFSLIFEENHKKLTNFVANNSDNLNCEDSFKEDVNKTDIITSRNDSDLSKKNDRLCDTLDFSEGFTETGSYEEIVIKTIKEDDEQYIDNEQYICEICGYITQRKSYLRDHMDTHSLNKDYKCNFCNKSFRGRSNFYRHRKIHIPKQKRNTLTMTPRLILENGEIKCEECNQIFKNLVLFKRHVKRHKKYVCEICGYATYRQSYLTDHKEVHSLNKPYTCSVCNKSYRGRTNYTRHKRIHLSPKQINCDLCGQKFTTKGTLKTHIMLIHIKKSKNFECIICNKKFSLKGTLMKHLRRHQQKEGVIAKSFKCIECNVEYYDKGSLKRHYSEKHNNEFSKFKCQYCCKEYVSKSNLSKHLKVYHKSFT